MTFTYLTFVHHPLPSLAFAALILGFISLWLHKNPWIWGGFSALSLTFACVGELIDFKVFIALGLLFLSHLFLSAQIKGIPRLLATLVALLISIAFLGHFSPGFHNWKLAENMVISNNGSPYTLYLNFDKPFIGFFPLALSIPLLHSKMHWRLMAIKTLAMTALGATLLIMLALHLNIIAIELKLPYMTPVWLIANLFLVTIPEEAFFRGFLQREITEYINTKWGAPMSIVAVSLLFALLHFTFVRDIGFLTLTFVASLIYGSIYHITRSIEGSIFCHYLFNIIHFFCFTYPALSH